MNKHLANRLGISSLIDFGSRYRGQGPHGQMGHLPKSRSTGAAAGAGESAFWQAAGGTGGSSSRSKVRPDAAKLEGAQLELDPSWPSGRKPTEPPSLAAALGSHHMRSSFICYIALVLASLDEPS